MEVTNATELFDELDRQTLEAYGKGVGGPEVLESIRAKHHADKEKFEALITEAVELRGKHDASALDDREAAGALFVPGGGARLETPRFDGRADEALKKGPETRRDNPSQSSGFRWVGGGEVVSFPAKKEEKSKPSDLLDLPPTAFTKSEEAAPRDARQGLVRLRTWDDIVVPKGATKIEALTYVPGVVGAIVDWIVAGAPRPSRVMALGVALGVVGTLIGRRVEGPRGCATHLQIFILAPTGYGKDYPLWCGNKLMIVAGHQGLIGPGEFVSGRGLVRFLKRNPLAICFVDELGDVFQLINNQQDNPWVKDLTGLFKKLYNSWSLLVTAESVHDDSITINHPAVTFVGACTPQSLFEALTPRDVESGFANRPMYLPFDGFKRPPEQDVPNGMDEPPPELVRWLKRLRPPKSEALEADKLLNKPPNKFEEQAPPVSARERDKIDWGSDEAKAAYLAFSREMDQWEDKDKRKFELGMRATENGLRCATVVAGGCFSPTVGRRDIEWALQWSRVSFEASCGGFEKYMAEYFKFPKFCAEVADAIQVGGFMSDRDLKRKFRKNMIFGNELDRALKQLRTEERIRRSSRSGSRGPAAAGWEIVEEYEAKL